MIAKQPIQKQYTTKVLDHLGLVAGMCQELKISELIDQHIPIKSPDKILSTGHAVVGLILNGLGFVNKRLYLVPQFFKNKPVAKLLNVSYLTSDHFNDDALGRSLDAVAAFGVSNLYALISSHAIRHLSEKYGLKIESGQLDNTNFHLHGLNKILQLEGKETLEITQGYSKDHRPDLVQIGLQLIVENQSRIPLLMEILSGNQEESTSYGQFIEKYAEQLQNNYDLRLVVVDSKLYNQNNLVILGGKKDLTWVTRVPNSLRVVKDLLGNIDKTYLQELEGHEKYRYLTVCSQYGSVKQRWIVLHSTDKYKQDLKQLNKKVANRTKAAVKAYKQLSKQLFETEEAALLAASKFCKSLKFNNLENIETVIKKQYNSVGKPKKGQLPDQISYTIRGKIESDKQVYEVEKSKLGYFILATNELEAGQISAAQLLTHYKNQSKVERSFRFLKDPALVASSLFVQKPERMMAILMIMTLCLLVYAALEFVTRTLLKKENLTFNNQVGKPIQNPTMKWIFQCFEGVHILYLTDNKQVVLNLENQHELIINLLGKNYLKFYT